MREINQNVNRVKYFMDLFFTEYPVACYEGSAPKQNLYPKGQNFVIRRPLAAEIEILKILHIYLKSCHQDLICIRKF